MVIFHSYVSLPEGTNGKILYEASNVTCFNLAPIQ